MTDEVRELVDGASRGEPRALDALVARLMPGLNGYLRLRAGRVLLKRESVSDLVQSVCREALEGLEGFEYESEPAFKAWVYTIAQRKIARRYEYYRAQRRDVDREVAPPSGAEADALLATYGRVASPSAEVAARDEVGRIEAAFAQLSEPYREVILLSRMLGLTHREIAAHMGRSEGSVRMLLSRALIELSQLLGD